MQVKRIEGEHSAILLTFIKLTFVIKSFVLSFLSGRLHRFYFTVFKIIRVGSHVVSVKIHCTEKWRTSFHTDVLSKSK